MKEDEYAQLIDVTASNYGHALRNILEKGDARADDIINWHHKATPDKLVTWVESHDTYCNAHESAGLTDDQIRMGWVLLTSRKGGKPLFFSRPNGSTRQNYWGDNLIGPRGNDEFFHPEVVAVNRFRKIMAGTDEEIIISDNGAVVEVARGNKGVALVNISDKDRKIKMATALPDGTYTDAVHGLSFTAKNGVIQGKLPALTSALLY